MFSFCGGLFARIGLGVNAPRAIEAGSVTEIILNHRTVDVGVVNDSGVHAADGGVIAEGRSDPFATIVPTSIIAEPVIDPAVKPDRRAPISIYESISPPAIGPIG